MAPTLGPTSTVAASATPPQGGSAGLVRESFTFLPPPPSSTNAAHHPLYVTADIASVQITLDSVNGNAPSTGAPLSVTTNLTITACPCTVYGPGVPPGSDTFTLTAYDEPNASGNLIATATPTYTIAAGQANNENVTLNGVPARFSLSFAGKAPSAGAPTTITLLVTVFDGDGNTIMGSYANAVTLADSDTSGATSIATSGSDNPPANELLSSNDSATVTYSGLAIVPATITATAKSATGSVSFAPVLQPITIITSDAQNPSFAGVDLYATSGAGSTGTFSASEVGWTNAPYNQSFAATAASGCSSIATVAPASGTSFTATVAGAPTAGTCTLTLADGSGQTQSVTLAYTQFTYTGGAQSIIVPAGVTSVAITAYGAQGAANAAAGGDGGEAQGTFTVTVGQTLYVFAGGQGSGVGSGSGGGYNGGGAGFFGGGGGGASDVRFGNNLIPSRAIVGGGGGGGGFDTGTTGGNGGGTSGSAGGNGTGGGFGGGGGTQTAGGGASFFAQPGGIAYGGYADSTSDGGGGGGGYYGGGGGSTTGGGGGGSSYIDLAAISGSTTSGVQSGNGLVILIW
jgi:hypothetical protein